MEFRKGDRVVLITKPRFRGSDMDIGFEKGDEATVEQMYKGSAMVKFDEPSKNTYGDGSWAVDPDCFRLLSEPTEKELEDVYRSLGVKTSLVDRLLSKLRR